MEAINEINVKALHADTGGTVRAAAAGQKFRVTLNSPHGDIQCLIVPPETAIDPTWDEIMSEVRQLRAKSKNRRPNPIIAQREKERAQRNYAHLR